MSANNAASEGLAYFDTSAFVPLIVREEATDICVRIWQAAGTVISTRLLMVETSAALSQAHRLGRLTARQFDAASRAADDLLGSVDLLEIDATLIQEAARLPRRYPLRGFDAVHVAAARLLGDAVMVSGDARVLEASALLGLSTVNTVA